MPYQVIHRRRFEKEFDKILRSDKKRKNDISELFKDIVKKISNKQKIDEKFHDHSLKGKYCSSREFHLFPDIIVIYTINIPANKVIFVRIGSHSDLFE